MQSTLQRATFSTLHIAIVMDGNGRWATRRALPRSAGHRMGVEAVRRIVESAPDLGIRTLTLYAFSSDNWKRPRLEVESLMRLLRTYLRSETRRFVESGMRLSVIGRRDRLPASIARAVADIERATRGGPRLHVRIALDYSARESIARAAGAWAQRESPSLETLGRLIAQADDGESLADVDLLIRTGGEQRLSDFLLWECAYAELYFTERMWPDFGPRDLGAAIEEFHRRTRRFGGLSDANDAPSAIAASR